MHANTLRCRANRERILATATRTIAEHGFARVTIPRLMADSGLRAGSFRSHFPQAADLLAVICERHARALLEATGCVDPLDPTPPRAALVATAARILACIDARAAAHTVLMRDRACLPPASRADLDYLDEVAAFQFDCAWSAIRPDLATPGRLAGLTRPLRALLFRWPEWREPGPRGHPDAAAGRAVAMVEATIDLALPASAHIPPPLFPGLPAHAAQERRAAHAAAAPKRHAARDADPPNPSIRNAPRDAPRHAGRDTQDGIPGDTRDDILDDAQGDILGNAPGIVPGDAPGVIPGDAPDGVPNDTRGAIPGHVARDAGAGPAPSHPGLALRDALARHGLPPGLAAARLGIPRQRLHQLTRGTRAITPDTALRLEALLGEHAETWMARQARHDIEAARRVAQAEAG